MNNTVKPIKKSDKKVCIIGAGCSGIAIMKELKDKNISYDCYEIGSTVGGVWRDTKNTPMYDSCRIHIRKELMAFPDFPVPKEFPIYMNSSQYHRYLLKYVHKHSLERGIHFNTQVVMAAPNSNQGWDITLDNGEAIAYDVLVVANGHYWEEKYPEFSGIFRGKSLHAKHYERPDEFKDKNVLVVGIGNTAVDIATDLGGTAKNVYLSTRSGAHIAPRFVLGKPAFDFYKPIISKLPIFLQRWYVHFIMWLGRGSLKSYGLPTPKHKLFTKSLSMSSDLFEKLGTGEIKIKPNVVLLHNHQVDFEDNSTEEIDAIIYATGYKPYFDFFEKAGIGLDAIIGWNYLHVININYPNLYFIGLVKPFGPNLPSMIIQAKWLAAILSGQVALPNKRRMTEEIMKQNKRLDQFYPKTDINRLRINLARYAKSIHKEMVAHKF